MTEGLSTVHSLQMPRDLYAGHLHLEVGHETVSSVLGAKIPGLFTGNVSVDCLWSQFCDVQHQSCTIAPHEAPGRATVLALYGMRDKSCI